MDRDKGLELLQSMSLRKKKILLIEDDRFLAGMYEKKLILDGFLVHVAHDGLEGIQEIRSFRPHVVLLDLLLPKKSGFEVLRVLKAKKTTASIPVIVLSNLSQTQDVERCMKMGASDYLVKSHFLPSEVLQKIQSAIAS